MSRKATVSNLQDWHLSVLELPTKRKLEYESSVRRSVSSKEEANTALSGCHRRNHRDLSARQNGGLAKKRRRSLLEIENSSPQANSIFYGIHNPGELNRRQLVLLQPGGICHVQSIVLGSFDQPAP